MHFDAIANNHGLPHDPFKAIVAPRPIGWISTISKAGILNLAPYSFFNAIADRPHYVMFSSGGRKDSVTNIEATGEFVCSLATYELRTHMNESSASVPPEVDEFKLSGLTPASSKFVKPPRVGESPAALECRLHKIVDLPGRTPDSAYHVVIGEVVGIYIDDRFIKDGLVDTGAMRPIARMGYMEYSTVSPETVFRLKRPA